MSLVHKILVIDAELISVLDVKKRNIITSAFISDLIKSLKMKKLGKLQICNATDKKYPGWSFIQPITTSHISGHYFAETKKKSHIHLDIYSCKEFKWQKVIKCANRHFALGKWKATLLNRSMSPKVRKSDFLQGFGGIARD